MNSLVILCPNIKGLLNLIEGGDRFNHVEDGNICPSFGEALRKGESTASRSARDQGRPAFQRELCSISHRSVRVDHTVLWMESYSAHRHPGSGGHVSGWRCKRGQERVQACLSTDCG